MSSNPKFTTEDAVRVMRHLRITAKTQEPMTVSQALDIAERIIRKPEDQLFGHYTNDRGERVPIPGAYSDIVDEKLVVKVPLKSRPKIKSKPVSIDDLCAVDGVVADAETHEPEPEYEPDAETIEVEPVEPEVTSELSEAGWAESGAGADDDE
jgi:hypothetical protein